MMDVQNQENDDDDEEIAAASQDRRLGIPSDDPWQRWSCLRNLLNRRYEKKHRANDLDEIISTDVHLLRGIHAYSSNLKDHVMRLGYLAVTLDMRKKVTLSLADNARAMYFRRLAINLLLDEPDLKAVLQSQMALNLLTKADEKGDSNLMDEACRLAHTALASNTQTTGVPYKEQLDTLANVLRQRYLLKGDPEDLERSIALLEEEQQITSGDDLGTMHNLSYSLSLRYQRFGRVDDLNRAIELGFKAMESPNITLESLVDRARNVVNFLDDRYKIYRDSSDIERAKALLQSIIRRVSASNSRFSALARTFSHLLRISAEMTNSLKDLESAITTARKGLAAQGATVGTIRSLENELGLLMAARHRRLGGEEDGLDAIQHFKSALDLAGNRIERSVILGNMSGVFGTFYRKTSATKYLDEAYRCDQEAIMCTTVNVNPNLWLNAANGCLRLYTADDRKVNYMSQGINLINQSLSAAHKWARDDWAQTCLSAGVLYELRYRRSKEAEDFTSALTLQLSAWFDKAASLRIRFNAVRSASNLLIRVERWREAWLFLQEAVTLIPIYCASALDQQDQQYVMTELSGLTALACSAGLVLGENARALEIWEQGRGVIVSSAHHAVSDLLRLKARDVDQYNVFCKYRALALEPSRNVTSIDTAMLDDTTLYRNKSRRDALASLDDLVKMIRRLDGFEDFLRTLSTTTMQKLAHNGAIVVLNLSEYRLHAIIITKQKLESLQLEHRPNDNHLFASIGALHETHARTATGPGVGSWSTADLNRRLRACLYILWNRIVLPVCNNLGYSNESMLAKLEGPSPNISACRIWWLTSGVLSRLPFHAAGIWAEDCMDVLLKRAVSSYAASFRILKFASERSNDMKDAKLQGLIVSMERPDPSTAYHKRKMFLKSARRERELIQSAGGGLNWAKLVRPSAKEVMQNLPEYPFVHFATHGISDATDPANSHLVLMRGTEDSLRTGRLNVYSENLSVTNVFQCTAENAVLAFLAACSTADVQVSALADEGLHIVNAFQISGFPHVVGTLWSASDFICPGYAEAFYSCLDRWDGLLKNDLIAFAAHLAVWNICKDYVEEPRLWACFVHMGP